MAQVFTKQDFYLLVFIMRWWRERIDLDEEEEQWQIQRREDWGLEGSDRDRLLDLAKRILAVVRSYPAEEEGYEPDTPEASEEGDVSSVENESVLGEH